LKTEKKVEKFTRHRAGDQNIEVANPPSWMDGWMDGWKSTFRDCLQQSKINMAL
jgi:hypothetical protein